MSVPSARRPFGALCAALVGMACASSGPANGSATPVRASSTAPKGRTCLAAARPEVLPPAAGLLDSAGLAAALSRIDTGRGYSLHSVAFTNQGQLMWVRVIETSLDSTLSRSVLAAVVAHIRPQSQVSSWAIRVRTVMAGPPKIQLERSEICPAMPHPGKIDVVTSRRVATAPGFSPAPRFGTTQFTLRVDTAGYVRDIRVTHSSGDTEIDRQFQAWLQNHRFFPSLIDGHAADMWVAWPVQSR